MKIILILLEMLKILNWCQFTKFIFFIAAFDFFGGIEIAFNKEWLKCIFLLVLAFNCAKLNEFLYLVEEQYTCTKNLPWYDWPWQQGKNVKSIWCFI